MSGIRLYTFTRREVERFLRVPIQTLVSPWISGALYITIFGYIIGQHINLMGDVRYIDFVFPGIVMMNIINAAIGQTSFSLYFQRFSRSIDEMLTAPLSYTEMIVGYIVGAVLRAVCISAGLFGLAVFFTRANIDHVGLFFFYIVIVSAMFGLLGLIVALWSEKFEHLSILQIFVITPLTYFGGIFNSIEMLPAPLQIAARFNPFFYMIDSLRYSMISFSESNLLWGGIGLTVTTCILFAAVVHLFRIGYKVRT